MEKQSQELTPALAAEEREREDRLARRLALAADEFNAASRDAARHGLDVSLDVTTLSRMGDQQRAPLLEVAVRKITMLSTRRTTP